MEDKISKSIQKFTSVDVMETLPTPATYRRTKRLYRPTLQDLRQKQDHRVTSIFIKNETLPIHLQQGVFFCFY